MVINNEYEKSGRKEPQFDVLSGYLDEWAQTVRLNSNSIACWPRSCKIISTKKR
jgi:hypothetical protein